MTQSRFFAYLVLFGGVMAVSASAIFIRLAQAEGVSSLVVAAWRLSLAALILTPLAWRRQGQEILHLNRSQLGWALLAGAFLAVHLFSWILSLEFTSVASSVVLVTTSPLWVALFTWLLFRLRLSRFSLIGLSLAFLGSIFITFSDSQVLTFAPEAGFILNWQNLTPGGDKASTALFGNSLAILGALTVTVYLMVGRQLRQSLSNTTYVWLVYSAGAVVMIGVMLFSGESFMGYSLAAYFWLVLVAVGPQLLGHTAFNWALARLSATFVALATLGEPIGSAILAYFVFAEAFAWLQLVGFVLILGGIALGIWGEEQID